MVACLLHFFVSAEELQDKGRKKRTMSSLAGHYRRLSLFCERQKTDTGKVGGGGGRSLVEREKKRQISQSLTGSLNSIIAPTRFGPLDSAGESFL